MASYRNRRITPNELQTTRNALIGIQTLPDYMPLNSVYSAATLTNLGQSMEEARQAEVRAAQALAVARDIAAKAEWDLRDAVMGAKTQVIAQYGADSNMVQLVGLKRKSERRRAVRRVVEA